jgi:uncharacterized integral membrane protein/exonuclease VII small subunit
MNLRTLMLLLLSAVIAVFAVANWGAFTTPTTLSLVFATVQAPLGLIMLALTGLLAALFLVYVVYLQAVVIVEARRAARDLAAQTELADKAEASRFTELRALLESDVRKLETGIAQVEAAVAGRVEAAAQALTAHLTDTEKSLSAHLGEVEDKFDRMLAGRG